MPNQTRLVIAIDCDDVLVPSAEKVVDYYDKTYGTKVDIAHFYGPVNTWGTTDLSEANTRIEKYFRHFAHEVKVPYPEAIPAIKELASKHDLHLVTGRADFMEPITKGMIDEFFAGCFKSIVHTNYFKETGGRSKGQVCRELGAHILIDDHVVHGESVLSEGVKNVIVFGDYPWNQRSRFPKGMRRCVDWKATVEEVAKIAKR